MDGGRRLRRNRLIFFAVLVGVPAFALIAYVAVAIASISSFGS